MKRSGATSTTVSRGSIYHKVQEEQEVRVVWKKRKAGEEEVENGRGEEEVEEDEEDCESGVSSDWEHRVMRRICGKMKKKKKKFVAFVVEEEGSTVTSLEEEVEQFRGGGGCSSSSRLRVDVDEDGDEMMVIVEDEEEEEEVESPTYVLSSGRSTRQVQKQLTIDDEFEEYFRQLML